jgi:ATP-dependent DNA ligase
MAQQFRPGQIVPQSGVYRITRSAPSRHAARGHGDQRPALSNLPDCKGVSFELVDAAPEGDQWLHEIKFDGYRMHARLDRGDCGC